MNQWSLLRSRQFFPQFITQFLGACNDNIFKNALIILIVFQIADSLDLDAKILVALASGLFILPFFLFSITAGQLADKYRKSQLVIYIKLAEVGIMLGAAVGFYWQNMTFLMLILFLLGIQAAFFGPLKYAILPELLKKEDLLIGNGLTGAATFIAILLGTIIGGILIMHSQGPMIISTIIILLALLGWLSACFIPKTEHIDLKQSLNIAIFQEMKSLLKYAIIRKPVYLSIMGISWFWLFGATILTLLPPFTKTILQGDETVVTFFMAIFSIGIALGSLIYAKISQSNIGQHAVYFSLLALSLFTADLGLSTHNATQSTAFMNITQFLAIPAHYRTIVDASGIAIFGGLYTVPLYTLIQTHTPATHRARMIALNNIMNALFMTVSAIALMSLASLSCSIQQTFLILSVGCCINTVIFYRQRIRLNS